MLRTRVLTIGAVAGLAAAGTAGCGAEQAAHQAADRAAQAIDPVAQAADVTDRRPGGVAMTIAGAITAAGERVPIEGSGVVDRKGRSGRFTMTFTAQGRRIALREILKGKVVYLSGDVFQGRLPGGKSWLRIDLAQAARKQGIDLDALGGSSTQDPAQALEYLKGAGRSRKVGTETVAGTPTTRYHVDVDLRRVAARSTDPDASRSVDKLIQMTGTATLPVDVWVDGDHLVRRERVAYDMTVGGRKAGFTMTIDLTRFGVPVDAPAPADADTVDATELGGAGASSGSGASS